MRLSLFILGIFFTGEDAWTVGSPHRRLCCFGRLGLAACQQFAV
jgi:hypothetical protein